MAKNLFVIIPTSGRADLLERTLKFLEKCGKPSIYRGAIVVENGKKGRAEKIIDPYREKLSLKYKYIEIPNKSNALNEVIKETKNSLIFFTDDDVRLDSNILKSYASAAEGRDSGYFYGGPYGVDYIERPPEYLNKYLPNSAVGWNLGDSPKYIDKDSTFIGFNWAAFSNDLITTGGFNVNHGPGARTNATGQETEMQWRLLKNGKKGYYIPGAKVWHFVPPERCSVKWALSREYRWGISQGLHYNGDRVVLIARWLKFIIKTVFNYNKDDYKKWIDPHFKVKFYTGMIKGTYLNYINSNRKN